VRYGEDVREQDRRVEPVALERLQRDLAGQFGFMQRFRKLPALARVARYSGR